MRSVPYPKKRLGEAANYNDVDRVPIAVPVFAGHLAAISGLKLIELTNDPKKLAYANFVAESRYGFDYMAANAVCDPYNITPEALGCKLKYYEESFASRLRSRQCRKYGPPSPAKDLIGVTVATFGFLMIGFGMLGFYQCRRYGHFRYTADGKIRAEDHDENDDV